MGGCYGWLLWVVAMGGCYGWMLIGARNVMVWPNSRLQVVKAMKSAAGWWREVRIRHSLGHGTAGAPGPACVPVRRCAVLGAPATLPPPADGGDDAAAVIDSLVFSTSAWF